MAGLRVMRDVTFDGQELKAGDIVPLLGSPVKQRILINARYFSVVEDQPTVQFRSPPPAEDWSASPEDVADEAILDAATDEAEPATDEAEPATDEAEADADPAPVFTTHAEIDAHVKANGIAVPADWGTMKLKEKQAHLTA